MINKKVQPDLSSRLKLWSLFFLFIAVSGYAMAQHELWGDEIHSWNIAKASHGLSNLITNSRYEGHPPVWYIILWCISKFTHDLVFVQIVQWFIACSVVFVILFYSPLSFYSKLLIPLGYYFLFEYGILSRNYAIGVLAAFCICAIIRKEFRYQLLLYYGLLFFMSNSHLLALLLAGGLHLYFLFLQYERNRRVKQVFKHLLIGFLVFLPSLYFIFPPTDSGLSVGDLVNKFEVEHLRIISKTPLRAFVPVPAWWEYNFWNTQFLLTLQEQYTLLRPVTLLLSLVIIGIVWFILKDSKKSLLLFGVNLFLTFMVSIIFPLTTQRYIGFIFIGFIAALWLMQDEVPITRRKHGLINSLLFLQVIGGIFMVVKDIVLPFSNSPRVNELINKVADHEKLVTDYWCVNTTSAFSDKAFYTLGLDSAVSFLQWKKEFNTRAPGVYRNSLEKYFAKEKAGRIFLVSTYTMKIIHELDPTLNGSFQFNLVDKREGAIEKWSNLYLYEVRPVQYEERHKN